jgi:hypothetical protein
MECEKWRVLCSQPLSTVLHSEVHVCVIAATLKVLNMANLEEEPGIPFPGDESSKED